MLCLTMAFVIFYINKGINEYDMRFYQGKDNGYFKRIESIILFSSLFFFIVPRQFRPLRLITGFIIGVAAVVVSYILISGVLHRLLEDDGLVFHVFSTFLCVMAFLLMERRLLKERTL